MKPLHIPVLLDEVLTAFNSANNEYLTKAKIKSGQIKISNTQNLQKIPAFIDCTLGYGGHSSAILERFKGAKLIACDQDENAYNHALIKFSQELASGQMSVYNCNFSDIFKHIDLEKIEIKGVLADIGVSSPQIDINERGFSLNSQNLDMRMSAKNPLNAQIILNEYPKNELCRVLKDYGQLPNASFLADKIISARAKQRIISAQDLSDIIGSAKLRGRDISLMRLVMQALRIEVNDELFVLRELLDNLESLKPSKCVVCVICFHSLEDKIVKERFKIWSKNCICNERALRCVCGNNHALGQILNKKPIVSSPAQIKANPRASCAKMRVFEFN